MRANWVLSLRAYSAYSTSMASMITNKSHGRTGRASVAMLEIVRDVPMEDMVTSILVTDRTGMRENGRTDNSYRLLVQDDEGWAIEPIERSRTHTI